MKISVIGAGNVGATCAMRLLEAGLGDIVIVDILESLAKGKAEDLMDAASLIGHGKTITGTSDYSHTSGSDIIVITAGFARTPGMSREELLNKNVSIVKEVAVKIMEHNKNPIIITVTNPLDIMTYVVHKITALEGKRVFGMAGALDSSRMNLMVSRKLNRTVKGIDSLVLGTHGQTMAPIVSHSKVDGKGLDATVDAEATAKIIDKTKSRGGEIVSYLGKGSAFYAPSAGVFRMVKAVIDNSKEIIPSSCLLNGEYGIDGIYLGVPAKIGKDGIEEIIELPLSEEEAKLLKGACDSVRNQIETLVI